MKKNELISNELKLKKNKINYLYIIIIFISFILGFYYNENSSGGAAIDSTYALINFKIFLSHKFKGIPWEIYSSSSLPLYYFILKFAFSEATKLNMIIANVSLFTESGTMDKAINGNFLLICTSPAGSSQIDPPTLSHKLI